MAPIENKLRRWLVERDDASSAAESVLIVGLGRFGAAVAETLTELDVEVLAIDTDPAVVGSWADQLAHVRIADGSSATTLRQLGAAEFDAAVVAVGSDIEASILSTAALVDIGVRPVWAKAITEQHGRILRRVGAHEVVYPEREMGERVAHVVTGQMSDYFQIDDGFVLAEIEVPSGLAGITLGDSGIRHDFSVTVVCIKPDGHRYTYATADSVLGPDDRMLVAGQVADIERFAEFASR